MKAAPALLSALLLAAGISMGDSLPRVSWQALAASLLLLILVSLIAFKRTWSTAILWGALVALGALLCTQKKLDLSNDPAWQDRPRLFGGKILEQSYRSKDRQVCLVRPDWISGDGRTRKGFPADLRLVSSPNRRLAAGAHLIIYGDIELYPARRNPGGRDWQQEFARQGVAGWVKSDAYTITSVSRAGWRTGCRSAIEKTLRCSLPPRQADLLVGMVLGDKSVIPEELGDAFRRSGLYHLLVVSGAHIGYLLGALTLLLSPLPLGLRGRRYFLLLGIWGYVILTGLNAPSLRAAIMISLVILSYEFQRVPRRWNLLGAAAFLILLFDPRQLFNPGFQLSFAAMAGVLFASDMRARRELAQPIFPRKSRQVMKFIHQYISYPFWTSLCAVIFTAPILSIHFGGYAPVAVLLNLLAIPLTGILFGLAWLVVLINLLTGSSFSVLNGALELGLRALEYLAMAGADLPGNALGNYGGAITAILLLLVLLGFFLTRLRRRRWLWMGAGVAGLLLLPLWNRPDYLQVEFLDVGQGDALLMRFPGGETLLVDCGDQNGARFELVPSLRRRGIGRINTLILTHFDRDHAGGAEEVMKALHLDRLVVNSLTPDDQLGQSILASARKKVLPLRVAALGDTISGFSGAHILALWPVRADHGTENRESLVLRITYGQSDFLLTGDIGESEERILLAAGNSLQSEVLKVAHHGSRKSSSRAFLEQIRPQEALIGCGENNRYGHPQARVLGDLEAIGSRIHRTDLQGATILRSDGKDVWQVDWR